MLISNFKSLRDELKFNRYYEDILQQSANVTDEPVLPRYRKRPKQLDDGVQSHCYQTPKDRYRHLYFEVLELACGEVERRFEQPDFLIIENLETTLIKSANGDKIVQDESLLKYLEGDIDKDRFVTQVTLIPDMIKTALIHSPIKKVTNLRTIADAMNKSEIYKGMLSEIDKG